MLHPQEHLFFYSSRNFAVLHVCGTTSSPTGEPMKKMNLLFLALTILSTVSATVASAQSKADSSSSKYFIVQNIATEKMRVYERCTTSVSCAHRLVFQTDMVAGKISGDKSMWTRVGTFKVEKWVKFYEDKAKLYPSWYDGNYPETPGPGNSFSAWLEKQSMPNGPGEMRGAFGWYAAMVTPNASGQWMHGTIGWGSDEDKFILQTRSFMANVFADPRSRGCTRIENRAVAFAQSFLPAGTDLFRVYAQEGMADEQMQNYENQRNPVRFDYILTRDQVRRDNPNSISRPAVEARLASGQIQSSDILEEGSFLASQYPVGQGLTSKRASSGRSGDTYSLGESAFAGVFLIDEGRFVNYDHPSAMPRGGVSGSQAVLPEYAKSRSENFTKIKSKKIATTHPNDGDIYSN